MAIARMKTKVTIRHVAQISGTSPSTVSPALTGSAIVSPEKREAVLQAVHQLNFRPTLPCR